MAAAKEDKHWIEHAIKHHGAFTSAAKKAGKSTEAFAVQHEHSPGVMGHRARLAKTLMHLQDHPVNDGDAIFAFKLSAVVTKAVVANCVVFVPAAAVGAAGTPVRVGEAIFAFNAKAVVFAVFAVVIPEVTKAVVAN